MKLLLTIDGVSFYTTATAIKRGVGQSDTVNAAARSVYNELMDYRKGDSSLLQNTTGCGGTNYSGHQAQINIV